MTNFFKSILRFVSFESRKAILLPAALLISFTSYSQSPVLRQTFGDITANDAQYPFRQTAVFLGGNSSAAGTFSTAGTAGTGAYGVSVGEQSGVSAFVQIDFAGKKFAVGSGATNPNTLSFDIASVTQGTGSGGRGFGQTTSIEVYININNNGFPNLPQLRIVGANQNGPQYGFGTAGTTTETTDFNETATKQVTDANRIGKATITLPPSLTQVTTVDVRIKLATSNKNVLLIDNVTLSSGNSALPLPVELIHLKATSKSQAVALNWATATEKNNNRFEVQRSADGQSFQTIGSVKGQGNSSSQREYSFDDSRPIAGQSYYRLRQVDTDGASAFSPVVSVQTSTASAVFPNPTADAVVLPATLGQVQYRVLNALGQTLLSGKAIGSDRLDLTGLKKGSYFLELTGATESTVQRVVRE